MGFNATSSTTVQFAYLGVAICVLFMYIHTLLHFHFAVHQYGNILITDEFNIRFSNILHDISV